MRERDLESAGGQEERDGIGAILEEVINRYESKIDLFCSSSRGREVSSRARARAFIYIRSLILFPGVGGQISRGWRRTGSTYREEPSRDISIATRLRVRDKPDPYSACRNPLRVLSLPLPSSDDLATPPRRGEASRYLPWGRRTSKGNHGDPGDESTDD